MQSGTPPSPVQRGRSICQCQCEHTRQSGCNVTTSLFWCVSRDSFFHDLVSCSVHDFLLGRRFNNPLGSERKCRFLQVFIPYVKTGWKNRKNAIDYRFGRERVVHVWKKFAQHIVQGPKAFRVGIVRKKSLQTMLLVGKRLCRKGRKMQSAMFFTIFCRWVVGKEGQKSVVDVGTLSSPVQLEWVEGFAEGILDTVGNAWECNV